MKTYLLGDIFSFQGKVILLITTYDSQIVLLQITDYAQLIFFFFFWFYSFRHISFFKELWDGLGDSVSCLKLVAVSKGTF